MRKLITLIFCLLPAATGATGAADFNLEAMKASRPIAVDGVLDPQEWQAARALTGFIQFEPRRGEAAQEKTEAFVLYDSKYLYVAFRCFDSQPERIAAQLTQRDSDLLRDDAVVVLIDTFNDSRSAYFFQTNALGTQADGRISDNGRVAESTWDASWRSAAARFGQGWTTEIAIPLSVLRFPPGAGKTWGLNLGRTVRRLLETSFWAGPLDERFRISQYGKLTGLDLETAQRKYEVIPYVLGQFQQDGDSDGAAGLDMRYAITPDNVSSATVNPDFATVEADQEEINLTRFEVGLREKRQFFLEGSEQYRQRIQVFYSRRIADIRFGGKLLGKTGGWQYSALTAQSDPVPAAPQSSTLDRALFSVLRLQRDILKSSTIGLMSTNRKLGGGNRGAASLDTTLFFTKTFGLTGQAARAHGPVPGGRWAYFLRPSRDTSTSHIHIRYTHLGDRFADNVNAIGFVRDDDHREIDSAIEKTFWRPSGIVERIGYGSNYNIYWSQRKALRSWQIDQDIEIDFRNRWTGSFAHSSEYKLFEKGFRNHQTEVQAGYNTREYQSVSAQYQFGKNFDSDFRVLEGSARRKVTDKFSVEYHLQRLWLDPDPDRDSTTIHVIRATHNFTRDLFVRTFFQTNSTIDRRNLQGVFVWRYKPPFGTIQFVFQRGTAAFGERSTQRNTVFVKLAYVL